MQVICRAILDGIGEDRRGRSHQPLVIEERPTERALKEIVDNGVAGMTGCVQILVDRQLLRAVHAHGQADRVTPGHVAIHRATVELVLLLVETMHQVSCATGGALAAWNDEVVDRERRVDERAGERAPVTIRARGG